MPSAYTRQQELLTRFLRSEDAPHLTVITQHLSPGGIPGRRPAGGFDGELDACKRLFPGLKDSTLQDFMRANKGNPSFEAVYGKPHGLRFIYIPREKPAAQNLAEIWPAIHAVHPEARWLLELSAPGFSAEMDQALLYAVRLQPGGTHSGNYHFFIRGKCGWKKPKSAAFWIA